MKKINGFKNLARVGSFYDSGKCGNIWPMTNCKRCRRYKCHVRLYILFPSQDNFCLS